MRTVTYGWRSVARRGHLTQRASQPSLWRWMPTSWRPRIPTNLEVRPLPGRGGFISNAAAPALPPSSSRSSSSLPSFLLCLCYACFHMQTATVAFMITAVPCLHLFFFQQCVYLVLFFEMFFSIACQNPACWQREALAAKPTFVIMSDVLIIIMT